ncbi:OLC1v1010057C1 [Oldenlandia corymbosa var. corymbosa]|uniref:OLC1v1010057C1 n=1 Tax=Oldenlandia corymbosa var. corymbosa TaxID=529605 RepID=A0AAV1DST2_OLDCO|nr:OLC1v1010057C1 [Oldenlandia corymbosa var. corymbosa]
MLKCSYLHCYKIPARIGGWHKVQRSSIVKMAATTNQQKHFVAVHGVGHGAWVYYKLKPRIEAAGHRFTPVDLAGAGVNETKLEEIRSLHDYTKPLLDVLAAVPENEKVVLIGHSGGGMSAAVGMEKYPNKISLAIFLNAIMPDTKNRPSYVLEKYSAGTPLDAWKDTKFTVYGDPPITALLSGPEFIATTLYHLSPKEASFSNSIVYIVY